MCHCFLLFSLILLFCQTFLFLLCFAQCCLLSATLYNVQNLASCFCSVVPEQIRNIPLSRELPRATIVLQRTPCSWKQTDQPYRFLHSYTFDQRHVFPHLQCHSLWKKHITNTTLLWWGQERDSSTIAANSSFPYSIHPFVLYLFFSSRTEHVV